MRADMHRDDRELARTIAKIIGKHSAAADALRELERLESAGEHCRLYAVSCQWLIGTEKQEPGESL